MTWLLSEVAAEGEGLNIVLLIGIAIFAGTVGAKLFQRFHIPQIVGYIAIGIILGPLVLRFISAETVERMEPFNVFALGIIGFMIGGELKRDVFTKFGKQVFTILTFEGITAFFTVWALSFGVMMIFADWQTSLAVAVVFGAICSATDPASSVNVLWEYKARGPLTTMLIAIVALDDALALVLYIISVSIAGVLTGHLEQGGLLTMLLHAVLEIGGSLALGVIAALILRWIIERIDDNEKTMVFTISTIVLTIGLAKAMEMDVILSSMALGMTLVNLSPRRSLKSFDLVQKFSPPIYVLFFVTIGARLNVGSFGWQVLLLVAAYVVGSVVGKTTGSYLGAARSKAVPTIRKYLGFCLYQQGTIAVALLLMASSRFADQPALRDTMLSVIIIGVFILQCVGPFCLKWGAMKAGETGMNVTEEDLVKRYRVGDVMDTTAPSLSPALSLRELIGVVSSTDNYYYCVVDRDRKLIGAVTIDGVRNTFATQELNEWLVTLDVMEPVIARISSDVALGDAMEEMRSLDMDYMPVVSSETGEFAGVLNSRAVYRRLSAEVLAKQRESDSMYSAGVVAEGP